VRNLFEDAIRQLANRIADVSPITKELLTRFEADDLVLADAPAPTMAELDQRRFQVTCPGCENTSEIPTEYLARHVECPCGARFTSDWGECV